MTQNQESKWIAVEERLPDDGQSLQFTLYGKNSRGMLHKDYFKKWNVTHWLDESYNSEPMRRERAIAFAEWMNNEDCHRTNEGWVMMRTNYEKYYTTTELYDLFLQTIKTTEQ